LKSAADARSAGAKSTSGGFVSTATPAPIGKGKVNKNFSKSLK
jgi:hypothetical protein